MIVVMCLAILAYFDLKKRTEVFFQASQNPGVKTIILDAGHGGEDPGAVSDYTGAKEKELNLKIAEKLQKDLEKEGFRIIMTRQEDTLKYEPSTANIVKKRRQDLETRKKIIDESGADIAVSIHMNKFPQTQYHGAQVFFPSELPESKQLADAIQLKIREFADTENKREALIKKEPLILLKNPKVITAIVECGFLSNAAEEQRLLTEDYQNKLSHAIKEGIVHYFKENAKKEEVTSLLFKPSSFIFGLYN